MMQENVELNNSNHVLSDKVNGDKIYIVTVSKTVPHTAKRKVFDGIKERLNANNKMLMLDDNFKLEIMKKGDLLYIKDSVNNPRVLSKIVSNSVKNAIECEHNLIMIPEGYEIKYFKVK